MKTIKSTNGFDFYVDDEDFDLVNSYKWMVYPHGRGYRVYRANCHTRNGEWHSKNATVHRFILKSLKGHEIDHIDGNPLNNQRSNLRVCSHQQNCWNKPLRKDSKTGLIGVRKHPKYNKWGVRIVINGKRQFVGSYSDPKEAALAYNVSASFACGGFARLNSV